MDLLTHDAKDARPLPPPVRTRPGFRRHREEGSGVRPRDAARKAFGRARKRLERLLRTRDSLRPLGEEVTGPVPGVQKAPPRAGSSGATTSWANASAPARWASVYRVIHTLSPARLRREGPRPLSRRRRGCAAALPARGRGPRPDQPPPNVVPVRHFGEEDGLLYLVMDLCEGESLRDLLDREGRLPADRAVPIALQVLLGLDAAHWEGVVHRDVKPANILVMPRDPDRGGPERVQVVDFGLALVAESAAVLGPRSSATGTIAGTVAYMSPEQVRADADVDARSDLFSVGSVLYEMLGGRPPFEGPSTLTVAMGVLEQSPPPLPEEGRHGVPAPVSAVCLRALGKDRERRWTACEMADALRGRRGRSLVRRCSPRRAKTAGGAGSWRDRGARRPRLSRSWARSVLWRPPPPSPMSRGSRSIGTWRSGLWTGSVPRPLRPPRSRVCWKQVRGRPRISPPRPGIEGRRSGGPEALTGFDRAEALLGADPRLAGSGSARGSEAKDQNRSRSRDTGGQRLSTEGDTTLCTGGYRLSSTSPSASARPEHRQRTSMGSSHAQRSMRRHSETILCAAWQMLWRRGPAGTSTGRSSRPEPPRRAIST